MQNRVRVSAVLLLLFPLTAATAIAQSIEGSATYRERMVLPPTAVFEVVLEDVSRADAPAETISRTRVPIAGNPPIAFNLAYDPARIQPNRRYVVRARILADEKLLFTTDTATTVITGGSPTKVALMLRRVGADQAPVPSGGNKPLEGTYWRATELGGKPTPKQDPQREAHLQFEAGGRVSGSDGCNRVTGSFQLKGDRVTFGQMAATMMACIDAKGTEGPFHDALKGAARLTVAGDRLELHDAAGKRLAVFTAGTQASGAKPAPGLAGTSWQLVNFQSSDDTVLTPDDRSKYTIEFAAGGQLSARIDCNRGSGTWKSNDAGEITFGPLALTRAQCAPGSLHDQIVKQWGNIRSYLIRDGHLFLALKIDGGIYEFEPVNRK